MKQEDFEEYIKHLQTKKFQTSKRPSLMVNNFYSIITIAIMSIAIILYVNFIQI